MEQTTINPNIKQKYNYQKKTNKRDRGKDYKEMSKEALIDEIMMAKEDYYMMQRFANKIEDSFNKLGVEYLRVCDLYNNTQKHLFDLKEEKAKNSFLKLINKRANNKAKEYQNRIANLEDKLEYEKRKSALYLSELNKAIMNLEKVQRFSPLNV